MKRRVRALAGLALLLAFIAPAWGAEETSEPRIEPRADWILKAACDYLQNARRYSYRVATVREVVLETGLKIHFESTGQVAIRRPDGLWSSRKDHRGEFRFIYDGQYATVVDYGANTYSHVKVPATLDEALEMLSEEYGVRVPLAMLSSQDLYAKIKEKAAAGIYVGLRETGGVLCHQLAFVGDEADWQMWVEDGLRPVIRKIAITRKNKPGQPQYVAALSDWDFAPQFPDSLFAFTPPEGCCLVNLETLKEEAEERR